MIQCYPPLVVDECLSRASYSILTLYNCMLFMFLTKAGLVPVLQVRGLCKFSFYSVFSHGLYTFH